MATRQMPDTESMGAMRGTLVLQRHCPGRTPLTF